jgi:hypothetical protein
MRVSAILAVHQYPKNLFFFFLNKFFSGKRQKKPKKKKKKYLLSTARQVNVIFWIYYSKFGCCDS